MDDYVRRVRLRAYLIWEREGRPEGREVEHWLTAEREVKDEEDAAGLQAGRAYDEGVAKFEKSGQFDKAARDARRAVDSKERDELERAEEIARRKAKDSGGKP
jgi:Protein of unknown function (DUF2934)